MFVPKNEKLSSSVNSFKKRARYLPTLVEREPFEDRQPSLRMVSDLGAVSRIPRFHNAIRKEDNGERSVQRG